MKRSRRVFLALAGSTVALPALPRLASALDYPTRPVHLVVGFPAGLSPDILARLVGQPLSERLGQQFIVDNRPGAASNIGTEVVAHAAPDGYTVLLTISGNAINATLYTHLNFNFARDLTPVAAIGRTPFVIVVNPAFPVKSVPEIIEDVRAGKLIAIGVTTPTRSDAAPQIPAIAEFVPGYAASGWYGICAPTGTPNDIIEKLNAAITACVTDPSLKSRLLNLGVEPMPMSVAEFKKFVADEIAKYAKVIQFAGIKVE